MQVTGDPVGERDLVQVVVLAGLQLASIAAAARSAWSGNT